MKTEPLSLDLIQIASPCNVAWDDMTGDARVRFCQHCKLQVYNLSEMERGEAEALISQSAGRTCVRLYRRHDGTVLTKDCPVGLRTLRQRLVRAAAALAAVVVAMVTGTLFGGTRNRTSGVIGQPSAFMQWLDPYSPHFISGMMVMPNPPPTVLMGGCPAPPAGLVTPPNSVAAAEPAESPLPPPTAEQLEQIQQRIGP